MGITVHTLASMEEKRKKKTRGFASTADVPWLHALQTKHSLSFNGQKRYDATPQCHLVTEYKSAPLPHTSKI